MRRTGCEGLGSALFHSACKGLGRAFAKTALVIGREMAQMGESPVIGHGGDRGLGRAAAFEFFIDPTHAHLFQVQHGRRVSETTKAVEDGAAADPGVFRQIDDGDRLVGVVLDIALDEGFK